MSYRDEAQTPKAFIGNAANTTSSFAGRPELCKLEEVGEIRSKLRQLEEAISVLTDERDRLGSKLEPVSQPRPTSNQKDVATSPSMTAIGGLIQQSIDRVFAVARSMNEMREDVGI